MHLSPPPTPCGLGCCSFAGGGSVVVDILFIVTPIVGVCNCSMFCCTLLYVLSSFAIILVGKRVLAALLSLSSLCLVMVVWLFLAVPLNCLRFVIAVFPDHNYLILFSIFPAQRPLKPLFHIAHEFNEPPPFYKIKDLLLNYIQFVKLLTESWCSLSVLAILE